MINYRITNVYVLPDDPQLVDGVDIETLQEREQKEQFAAHLKWQLRIETDRAFYGGEPPKLPKP